MRTKNKISLLYKSIYGIILLGLFCAAFGVTGLSTARAQQQVATATPTAHTQVHKSSLDGERDSDDAQVGPESLAAANAPELSESSISVPYLSQYTGANTQNVDCGPATVAMVTMAYGKHSVPPSSNSPEARAFIADIRAKMGAIGISGTSNQQRINALAAYGINSTAITSSTPLQTIKDAIAQGRLSIARVLGRTLGRNYDGHVVVVLGFSADFATVYVNDPDNQSRYLNTSTPGGANRAWATSTFEAAMIAAHDSGGYSYYGLVVNNSLATYSATYVTQSPYPTVVQGQSIDLSVTFQNTGNLSWSNTGANPANLGTINPNNISVDYPSPFVCPSWLWGWRPTHMTESTVVPGSNATFNFKICVPANIAPGTYRIAVAPLIEQVTWMFQPGVVVYWDITVTSGTGTDCGHVAYTGVILYQNIICNKDASGTTKAFSSPTDWIDTVSDFNDITSSIYISPGWSIKVFQDSLEQGGGSWRCLTGSMWDLRIDSYTNGDTGRVINDDISSVQIYNQNNCQSGKPDLIPSPLEGRDDPIVISSVLETNTNDTLYAGQPIYIDWGYTNIGTLDITNTNYYVDLYIDNEQQIHYPFTWLGAGAPGGFDDWGITWNTPGWHTVKLIVDPENTIAESNENNNVWEKQFYWNPSGQPDLIPSPLEGRQDPVVISSIQGTNTNDTLYVGKPIYIDWGYTNVGSMDVIDTDYHVDLYIDNEQQIHYPFTWLGVGAQGGFDDWGIT